MRRLRDAARPSLLVLGLLLAAPLGLCDVVWKVADEGPRAPDEVEVLDDESRTLAFGPEGDWELRGTEWRPVALRTTEVVGAKRTLFFAQGLFGALTQDGSACLVQLNRPLNEVGYGGDAWAEVRRVGGAGRFGAHGVVNDAATSDGTLLPMAGAR